MNDCHFFKCFACVGLMGALLALDAQTAEIRKAADIQASTNRNDVTVEARITGISAMLLSSDPAEQNRGINAARSLATTDKARMQSEQQVVAGLETLCASTNREVGLNALEVLARIEPPRSVPIFRMALRLPGKWQHLIAAVALLEIPSTTREDVEMALTKLLAIILAEPANKEGYDLIVTATNVIVRSADRAKIGFPDWDAGIPEAIKQQRLTTEDWLTRPDLIKIRKSYQEKIKMWWNANQSEIVAKILSSRSRTPP